MSLLECEMFPEWAMGAEFFTKSMWADHCNHGRESFLGCVKYGQIWHDVYLFKDNRICIRYGDEPSEYIGSIPVCEFLIRAGADKARVHDRLVAYLICKKLTGKFQIAGEQDGKDR